MNEEFPHLEVGGVEEILPRHCETEDPLDCPWEYELPKAYIQDLSPGCDIARSCPQPNPHHHSSLFNLPLCSVVAFLSLE